MPAVDEDCELGRVPSKSTDSTISHPGPEAGRLRKVKSAIQTRIPFWGTKDKDKDKAAAAQEADLYRDDPSMNYTSDMVDVLDTLGKWPAHLYFYLGLTQADPEVATLTSLTNMQNSLFIPNLPFLNRRPTYNLRRRRSEEDSLKEIERIMEPVYATQAEERPVGGLRRGESQTTLATIATIDSQLSESRYAVLPHGASLDGWSKQDKKEVNDHVRHMLHSRRSKFKRSMRGFGQYVRRRKCSRFEQFAFQLT